MTPDSSQPIDIEKELNQWRSNPKETLEIYTQRIVMIVQEQTIQRCFQWIEPDVEDNMPRLYSFEHIGDTNEMVDAPAALGKEGLWIVCKRCGDGVKDNGKRICFQCSEEQAPIISEEGSYEDLPDLKDR